MKVIDHGPFYEFCEWEGDIYKVYDAMKGLEKKPIRFQLDPKNVEASEFYRSLLEKGKIRMTSIVFEVVR